MDNTVKDENIVYKAFTLSRDGESYRPLKTKSGGTVYNTYSGAKGKCKGKGSSYQTIKYKLVPEDVEIINPKVEEK